MTGASDQLASVITLKLRQKTCLLQILTAKEEGRRAHLPGRLVLETPSERLLFAAWHGRVFGFVADLPVDLDHYLTNLCASSSILNEWWVLH